MFEKETLEDAVLFLLEKNKADIDPAELIYLLYTADIFHALQFGRTITNSVKDKMYMLMKPEDMRELCIRLKGKTSDYKYLSITDRKALDFMLLRSQLDDLQKIPMCVKIRES